ncbi:ORF3 [Blacklegged tick chuvirus 2]|uniref:ORF3 n=1 Tax=Blacklegged tick chuvirus 2 TaxID=2079604 RepID=A0A2K9YNG1_9VIRU|nr:ORF3 [Blacklegged tick chuvirus-2]AUW34384.1 ORF3 [Blacklegged tick chuvirus-2]
MADGIPPAVPAQAGAAPVPPVVAAPQPDPVPAAFQRWASHFSNMLTRIPQNSPPGLQRGVADHATNNARIFGQSVFTSGLITRNLNVYPFGEGRPVNFSGIEMAYVISTAVLATHGRVTEGERIALTIGEVSAAGLPPEMFADQELARTKFCRAVKVAMRTPRMFHRYFRVTPELYAIALTGPPAEDEEVPDTAENLYRSSLHGLGLPAALPWEDHTGDPSMDPLRITAEVAMKCLMWFVKVSPTNEAKNLPTTVQVNYFIAYSKMGNATEAWLARTYGSMETEGVTFDRLLPGDLANIFAYYGRKMVGQSVRALFVMWESELPEHLMRLKLVLNQAAGSGLTPYLLVVKAMKTFPDFPWMRIRRLFSSEFAVFERALDTIGGNMYFAFENNLTEIAGTKYRNVTWVARHVLMEFGGEATLRGLRGYSTTCKSIDVVRTICEEYRTRLLPTDADAPITAQEQERLDNIIAALRNVEIA